MIAKLFILAILCALVTARSAYNTSAGSKFNINDFLSSYNKTDGGSGSSFNIQDYTANSNSGSSGINNDILASFNKPSGASTQSEVNDEVAGSGDDENTGTDETPTFNKEELIASLLGGQGQAGSKPDLQSLIANRPAKNRKNQETSSD